MAESRRRLAFGSVAELYDRARPSYPPELVDDVLAFAGVAAGDPALEVGAGTGKATVLFASRGLRIVALEPSAEMASVARSNLAGYENVSIEQVGFEGWRPQATFKLLLSAQAWHWVSRDVRYTRARAILADGGALAVFWNRPRWDANPLRAELAETYRRSAPALGADTVGPGPMDPGARPAAWWEDWSRDLQGAPGFEPPEHRSYAWSQQYTSDEYVTLLQTHSDHIVLPDEQRHALFGAVARMIERHGGAFTLEYETALWLARAAVGSGLPAG